MRLLVVIIACFFTKMIHSQSDILIQKVILNHQNSIVMNSKIEIVIYQDPLNEYKYYVRVEKSNYSEKYSISQEKFLELNNALFKIKTKDIMSYEKSCLDGGGTEIQFINDFFGGCVSYSVYCLSNKDDNTPWKDFLFAVNLILDLANLKISDLK